MLGVAILGLAAVAASGRLGELPPTVTSSYVPPAMAGDLDAASLRAVRFSVTARGYAMDQVDELLDRLASQLERGAAAPDRPAAGPAGQPQAPDEGPEPDLV